MYIKCRFLLDKGINPRHRMYVVLKCDQNGKRKINTYFDHLYSITIDRPILNSYIWDYKSYLQLQCNYPYM